MSGENLEKPKWSLNWKLAVGAWVLFAISLFCPFFRRLHVGFYWVNGWASFGEVVLEPRAVMRFVHESVFDLFEAISMRDGWGFFMMLKPLHFVVLTLGNFFMIGSLVLNLNKFFVLNFSRYVKIIASIFFMLGCLYLGELVTGYFLWRDYMWVISFALLVLSIREQKTKQES
jgi:hypothetical protein